MNLMYQHTSRTENALKLPLAVFLFILVLLVPVQLKVANPMLLLERFIPGGGWFEMVLIALYGAVVAYHMQDPAKVQVWRRYTWLTFSLVFFSQLILGLMGFEKFLMTGKVVPNAWPVRQNANTMPCIQKILQPGNRE